MRKIRSITIIAFWLLVMFHFQAMAYPECNREVINGYLVQRNEPLADSLNMVNALLRESVPVYELTQALTMAGRIYQPGDFIIALPDSRTNLEDDIYRAYIRDLAKKFHINISSFTSGITTQAMRLHETRVAVYFGQGTSGGALWHINPAENAGFDVDILLETDIQAGDFAGTNLITFPSGGFYSGYLGESGNASIQSFIAAGNGFFGTCGGNVYGVELGLLDVQLDLDGQWPAAADLRGPIQLTNQAESHPALYTINPVWAPNYWTGQNFSFVADGVTVLSRYTASTPDLKPYDPAISRAYGYSPNTETINRFWGRPAIVSGSYGLGKVVLSGVHPELYANTWDFYLNTLLYLNSAAPAIIDDVQLATNFVYRIQPANSPASLVANEIVDLISLLRKIKQYKKLSMDARMQFEGLETENEKIADATGEFLLTFLDEQISRSDQLMKSVIRLAEMQVKFDLLRKALAGIRTEIPVTVYETINARLDAIKNRISYLCSRLETIDALFDTQVIIQEQMAEEKADLQELINLRNNEGESQSFYDGVIALYSRESTTLHTVKLETSYPVLRWSLQAHSLLSEAEATELIMSEILKLIK